MRSQSCGRLADSAMQHSLAVLIHDHQVDVVGARTDTGEIVSRQSAGAKLVTMPTSDAP